MQQLLREEAGRCGQHRLLQVCSDMFTPGEVVKLTLRRESSSASACPGKARFKGDTKGHDQSVQTRHPA